MKALSLNCICLFASIIYSLTLDLPYTHTYTEKAVDDKHLSGPSLHP